MQKILFSIGALAIAATVAFIWSQTVLVSPHAGTATTVGLGQRTAGPISPIELMMNRKDELPVEQWEPY